MGIVERIMSNQQWPPPRGNDSRPGPGSQSPWSQPDSRWSPQDYKDTAGRDPRLPFGQDRAPVKAPDMRQFEPPRPTNKKTLWLGVSILAAIVALVLILQFTGGFSSSDTATTPTSSGEASNGTSLSPAIAGGTAIPFEGNGTGLFEILSQEWNDDGLSIDYRISLDEGQGERSFSLYMFTNATLEVADPVNYELATVTSGSPFTGTVQFAVEQERGTLVLSSFSTALAALAITG